MAYIYRKTIHGKPYYYLRVSTRVKDRVIAKDVAYLGNDISAISAKLDSLPAEHREEIRKGHRKIKKFLDSNHYLEKARSIKLKKDPYLDKELLEEVEAARLHFETSFLKHDASTIRETFKEFLIDFAFNSTSIEGNTITLKEAAKLLNENLTPKERSPREIFDLQNTERVFFYLLDEKPKFDQELIIKIHDMLMENIDNRKGYRNHEIKVFKSHFDASPAKYIKTDMNLLFRWYDENETRLHPLALASIFHHKLEKIHPFSDGNGRTGRIIMNHILISREYPPLSIQKKNRAEYLDCLSKADNSDLKSAEHKHYAPLVKHTAGELVRSYWNTFDI